VDCEESDWRFDHQGNVDPLSAAYYQFEGVPGSSIQELSIHVRGASDVRWDPEDEYIEEGKIRRLTVISHPLGTADKPTGEVDPECLSEESAWRPGCYTVEASCDAGDTSGAGE
jgi:hypothetical protein